MGTLVSIILIATAFLTVAAVLYFVVTEKQGNDSAASFHDGTVIGSGDAPSVPLPEKAPLVTEPLATENTPTA
ncbi:MAG: hypothetical protein SGI73_16115 [Chloroflexota bacterium]|nr:hypothetical protein [Chloroflexota bacterium]